MNKVYIYLSGGLGNNLFQISLGLILKKRYSCNVTFLSASKNVNTLLLKGIFKNDIKIINNPFLYQSYFLNAIFRFLEFIGIFKNDLRITSNELICNYRSFPNLLIISGYWQDNFHIQEVKDLLCSYFDRHKSYNETPSLDFNSVCVHYRLGDYLQDKQLNICNHEYYLNALKLINFNFKSKVYLFTNNGADLSNLKLPFTNFIIIDNNTCSDLISFQLMRRFNTIIIPNSTFSFWAAFLNCHHLTSKFVIAPKLWKKNVDGRDLNYVPSTWISI